MNRQELLEVLSKGAAFWNKWRGSNGPGAREKINLAGVDLSRRDLAGIHFNEARLEDAKLKQANLEESLFFNAQLIGADLSGAKLFRAGLNKSNLSLSKLRDADLTNADLSDAILEGADLTNANLSGARLTGANLAGAKLDTSRLTERQRREAVNLPLGNAESVGEAVGEIVRSELVIIWDPSLVSPDDYALLVANLGDLVRFHGGIGVSRIESKGYTVESPVGVLS